LLLGDLNIGNKASWPCYEDGNRQDYLREVPAYKDLVFYFLKEVLHNEDFSGNSFQEELSGYVDATLEAYLVLTYVNSYANWMDECTKQEAAAAGGSVSELSNSDSSAKRFTSKGRGSGKYRGWSQEGIELYNEMVDVIEKQRQHNGKDVLKDFERDLQSKFVNEKSGNRNGGDSGRPKKKARNSIGRAP
jgi:transcription elongation factor Elf1